MSSVHTLHRIDATGRSGPRDLRRTGLDPDHWYPLARARDLKPGKTLAVTFAGEPIVLVRPQEGAPYALEDRCAHRQVPLHLGVVKGERLLCSYHCWAYNSKGQCINVPYLDEKQTLPNGVRSYACREAYGFIFVFTGNQALAETVPMPDLPTYSNPKYKTRLLDRTINCHYSFMHENLMDMNHQFLHRSLMGSIRATLLDVREGDNWLEVDYTFTRPAGKQPMGEWFMIQRRDDGTLPVDGAEKDIMTIRTSYPYQSLRVWVKPGEPALDVWLCYTPMDAAQRTNRTFGYLSVKKAPIPGLTHLMWPLIHLFTEGIFRQDKRIVELEQRAHDAQGCCHNNEVFPPVLDLRGVLGRCGVRLPGVIIAGD